MSPIVIRRSAETLSFELYRNSFGRGMVAALVGVLLAGCAAKRSQYDVPVVPVPASFPKALSAAPAAPQAPGAAVTSGTQPAAAGARLEQVLPQWWRLLGSAELDGLVQRAIDGNPELKIAALRVQQARARTSQAVSDQLPVLTGSVQQRREAAEGDIGGGVTSSRTPARSASQVGLRADFRLDIWGERQSQFESAQLQERRAMFQRDDVQRNLVANVVAGYIEYLSFNDRLRVATETDVAVSGMLAAVEARLERGDATLIDMEQQRAAVYSVKATIPALEQQRDEALNNLAVLLGVAPGSLQIKGQGLAALSYPTVLPGVPSALLLRRPDVRVMEARLLAADADIDAARTRLLPPLDLSAQAGYGSRFMSRLFEPQTLFWNLVGSLSATIFDHGRRGREVDVATAVHQEMVETYARVIYGAVREVDDALGGIRLGRARLGAQREAAQAARRAWDYSRESYQAGGIDHLLLLDTERTYHRMLDEQHNIDLQRYRALINLFSALGGGTSGGDPLPGKGKRPAAPAAEDTGRVLADASPAATAGPAPLLAGEWQLELAAATDTADIAARWRDLQLRFPDMMNQRTVAARKQQGAGLRVFLARFANGADAEIACARLREQHIACRAVGPDAMPDGALPPAATGKPAPVTHQPALFGRAGGMARLP
jgi:NodT family efflux transporter outer membrane factor (OMF) lipoprotein